MSDELANSTIKMVMPKRLTSSEDYYDWAYNMKHRFVIEGSLLNPGLALDDTDEKAIKAGRKFKARDQAEYQKTNAEARSTIINCLGPAQQALVDHIPDAKGVWNKLRSNYTQNINQQIAALETQLATVAQGTDTIDVYSYKIERICRKMEFVGVPISGNRKLRTFL